MSRRVVCQAISTSNAETLNRRAALSASFIGMGALLVPNAWALVRAPTYLIIPACALMLLITFKEAALTPNAPATAQPRQTC